MQKQRSDLWRMVLAAVSTAALLWVLLYAPTPYVVYEPGLAVSVKPMMTIQEGDNLGDGGFLLTAVKLSEPSFLRAIQSMWNSSMEVHLKRDVLKGYSKEQYAERLHIIMQGSQNNAIEAAYRFTGLPYESVAKGIIITDVRMKRQANKKTFKAGDKLLRINGGKPLSSVAEAFGTLRGIHKSKKAVFDIERGGERLSVTFSASIIDYSMTNEQVLEAIGITTLTELRSLEPADSRNRLTIAAGDIAGPSAGLVFALQALDLLTAGDLPGGRRIAATGTITVEGKVGAIGGIEQKIVIASEEDAQLFLVPADNFREAHAKAKALGTSMKVVSVDTLQDAVDQIKAFHAKNA